MALRKRDDIANLVLFARALKIHLHQPYRVYRRGTLVMCKDSQPRKSI
jgi:hypothetical protein